MLFVVRYSQLFAQTLIVATTTTGLRPVRVFHLFRIHDASKSASMYLQVRRKGSMTQVIKTLSCTEDMMSAMLHARAQHASLTSRAYSQAVPPLISSTC